MSTETAMELIKQFEPSSEGREKGQMGIDGFMNFLVSDECNIFDPIHTAICQDMGQPLSAYFIASSHNT